MAAVAAQIKPDMTNNTLKADLDNIKALMKTMDKDVINELKDLNSVWKTYTNSIVIKEFKSNEIGQKLDEISQFLKDNPVVQTDQVVPQRNNDTQPALILKLKEHITSLNALIGDSFGDQFKKREIDETYNKAQVQAAQQAAAAAAAAQVQNPEHIINTREFDNYINAVKDAYNKSIGSGAYTISDIKGANQYFKEGAGTTIEADITKKHELIKKKTEEVIKTLIEYAKKYGEMNSRIKNDVLYELEPKNIEEASKLNIVEKLDELLRLMVQDIKTNKSKFASAASALQQSQGAVRRGGGRKKVRFIGGSDKEDMDADRKTITDMFKNEDTTQPSKITYSIDKKAKELRKLVKILYDSLQTSSDPATGTILKGNDSLFNILYNKYIADKEDPKKGDYIASAELLESLKATELLPDEVLKVTMQDKLVFIFATLFIRLMALSVVEILIYYKKLTRLDTVVIVFLIVYTLLTVSFILIVNFDDYKLRIIFNYVNFHNGLLNASSYITMLWIFGGIIYYIMYNINDTTLHTAASDEDRIRLQYKIQVLSMISWIFISFTILLM